MYHDLWAAISIGFLLELLLGTPGFLSLPEKAVRRLISLIREILYGDWNLVGKRKRFGKTVNLAENPEGKNTKKILKWILLAGIPVLWVELALLVILLLAGLAGRPVFIAVESIMVWSLLSIRSPGRAGMRVYRALKNENMEDSRALLTSMIGQDAWRFGKEHVITAGVEFLSANTVKGAAVPLFWTALGGPFLGWFVEVIRILEDEVVSKPIEGSGRLFDATGFIPARIGAIIMMLAVSFTGQSLKGAIRIYKRDRKNGSRLNDCQCVSVCAGALGIRLMGPTIIDGGIVDRPYVGDPNREPEARDIKKACGLMYETAFFLYLLFAGLLIIVSRIM